MRMWVWMLRCCLTSGVAAFMRCRQRMLARRTGSYPRPAAAKPVVGANSTRGGATATCVNSHHTAAAGSLAACLLCVLAQHSWLWCLLSSVPLHLLGVLVVLQAPLLLTAVACRMVTASHTACHPHMLWSVTMPHASGSCSPGMTVLLSLVYQASVLPTVPCCKHVVRSLSQCLRC